jgi:hypothetical protein
VQFVSPPHREILEKKKDRSSNTVPVRMFLYGVYASIAVMGPRQRNARYKQRSHPLVEEEGAAPPVGNCSTATHPHALSETSDGF